MNGEIINFLDQYTKSGTPVNNLNRFAVLMDKLGNPQEYLKFVHVAGTNGKGSTVRMLASSLIKAGYRTGEFTSPFIYRYNDRMKINGIEIPDEELLRIIRMLRPILDSDLSGYSQFEITNAIAFIWFAEHKCDVVVLETGVGGLYDSTNIIRENVCSVITSISYDHTAILGNTIEEIAFQKAGIIKDECPVVLYPENTVNAVKVVEKYAAVHGSRLVIPDASKIQVRRMGTDGCAFTYRMRDYATAMPGRHQILNAVTAIEAAKVISKTFKRLTDKKIFDGISTAVMPSRCQIVRNKSPMVIIDGAHNPDGMKALADFVSRLPQYPKIMICGMSADKDWEKALSFISPHIDKAFCIDGFCPKTVFAPKLAKKFADAECVPISQVYHRATVCAGNTGLLLIAGSLYIPSALNKFTT
ncbi:MAG: bifunctional folylpolyglutamate synthase/dihydrofolate synthase [Oscillospiraceae bacterium]|nr:bifunctional folylpolyglutamate synthase/dihydrofolate synthase [Oscillospiraceae bacterium]